MSTPSYLELVSAVRREGEAIVAVSRQGLDDAVPTCPGWSVADLVTHVAGAYAWVAEIVGERLTAAPEHRSLPAGDTPTDVLAEALDALVEALRSCDPDTPVWNWAGQPPVAAFWARRMVHESTVHRFDGQRAHGLAEPVEADLAHDGLDELVDVIVPRLLSRSKQPPPDATYVFAATDDGVWQLRFDGDGLGRLETAKAPDITVRGTASALFLAACNRVPWTSLDVDGDTAALDAWSAALQF